MILRVERIDKPGSMTFDVQELPEIGDILFFGGRHYKVERIIKFTSHTAALVKEVKVIKLLPLQNIGG